jgi:hypothetical protein
MAQEFRPSEIVPQSGIYTITHDPAHADMPHEVTVIKGRRFPTCRHCKGIRFELSHAAKHVGEINHLEVARAPGAVSGSRFRHGAGGSRPSQRRDRAAMDRAAAHAAGRCGAGRRRLVARNQIRRLPHACAP